MMVKGRNVRRDGFDYSASGPIACAGLTPTQMTMVQGVRHGFLNKRIAFDLDIAETTVKAQMTTLMPK